MDGENGNVNQNYGVTENVTESISKVRRKKRILIAVAASVAVAIAAIIIFASLGFINTDPVMYAPTLVVFNLGDDMLSYFHIEYNRLGYISRICEMFDDGDSGYVITFEYDGDGNMLKMLVDANYLEDRIVHEYWYEDGLLVKENLNYSPQYPDDEIVYFYDEDGRLIAKNEYNTNSLYSVNTRYKYDGCGRLIEERSMSIYDSHTGSLEYDKDGNLVMPNYNEMLTVAEYTYDENGNEVKWQQAKFQDGRHTTNDSREQVYDENGNLIRKTEIISSGKYESIYSYSADGKLIEEMYSYPNGSQITTAREGYEYDIHGNFLKKNFYRDADDYYTYLEYTYTPIRTTEAKIIYALKKCEEYLYFNWIIPWK